VTEAELDECKNVFEQLKTTLAGYPNCLVLWTIVNYCKAIAVRIWLW
jgi:hypothetical protein